MKKVWYPLILPQEFHAQPWEGKPELLILRSLDSLAMRRTSVSKATGSNTVKQHHMP